MEAPARPPSFRLERRTIWGAKTLGASVAGTVWLTAFRLLLGASSAVDAAGKFGWIRATPGSRSTGDFQPSPLGALSSVIELVFGLLVFFGIQTRTATLVLLAHLALGLLAIHFFHRAEPIPEVWDAGVFFIAIVLAFGPGWLSVDRHWPDAMLELVQRLRGRLGSS